MLESNYYDNLQVCSLYFETTVGASQNESLPNRNGKRPCLSTMDDDDKSLGGFVSLLWFTESLNHRKNGSGGAWLLWLSSIVAAFFCFPWSLKHCTFSLHISFSVNDTKRTHHVVVVVQEIRLLGQVSATTTNRVVGSISKVEFESQLGQRTGQTQEIGKINIDIVNAIPTKDTPKGTIDQGCEGKGQGNGLGRFLFQDRLENGKGTGKHDKDHDDTSRPNNGGRHFRCGRHGGYQERGQGEGPNPLHMLQDGSRQGGRCLGRMFGKGDKEIKAQNEAKQIGRPNPRFSLENAIGGPHHGGPNHGRVGQEGQIGHRLVLLNATNRRKWCHEDYHGRPRRKMTTHLSKGFHTE